MKRAVVVLRFGISQPSVGDIEAIKRLTDGTMEAMGHPHPIGIVSVLYTDMELSEIKQVFNDVEEDTNDFLPVMIFNWGDPNVQFDLKTDDIEDMFNHVPNFCEDQKEVVVLTLDDILDKISRTGVESLEQEELALLKSFAKSGK
jgi:hypothetical protein